MSKPKLAEGSQFKMVQVDVNTLERLKALSAQQPVASWLRSHTLEMMEGVPPELLKGGNSLFPVKVLMKEGFGKVVNALIELNNRVDTIAEYIKAVEAKKGFDEALIEALPPEALKEVNKYKSVFDKRGAKFLRNAGKMLNNIQERAEDGK